MGLYDVTWKYETTAHRSGGEWKSAVVRFLYMLEGV